MKNKTKFILIEMKVQNGEYEYRLKSVHEISARKNVDKFANDYAKTFYGNLSYSDGDTHYFNGGEVAVRAGATNILTKEQYDILNRYI